MNPGLINFVHPFLQSNTRGSQRLCAFLCQQTRGGLFTCWLLTIFIFLAKFPSPCGKASPSEKQDQSGALTGSRFLCVSLLMSVSVCESVCGSVK